VGAAKLQNYFSEGEESKMGILNRFGKSAVDPFDTTIIANGTKVKGEIEVGGNVHVDGEFTGPIRSNRIVSIGKGGGD